MVDTLQFIFLIGLYTLLTGVIAYIFFLVLKHATRLFFLWLKDALSFGKRFRKAIKREPIRDAKPQFYNDAPICPFCDSINLSVVTRFDPDTGKHIPIDPEGWHCLDCGAIDFQAVTMPPKPKKPSVWSRIRRRADDIEHAWKKARREA